MRKTSKQPEPLANFIGSKRRPVEILVTEKMVNDNMEDSADAKVMKVAFKGLQVGFGFGLGFHNLTVCEYADILKHLQPTSRDATSNLSTLHTPVLMESEYVGLRYTAKLVRMTDSRRKKDCDALESLIVAHQYVLSRVCTEGDVSEVEKLPSGVVDSANTKIKALTWSLCLYCVRVSPMAGMQDFLRLVDTPIGNVDVQCDRSTLYSREVVYPSEDRTLGTYCWPNTPPNQVGLQNEALYVCYTLLPSMAGGLVADNIEDTGIYLTVSEEVVRGHTGERGSRGKYYEWVAPVVSGVKGKRVRTLYLTVGCSIVLPSTFVVRLGAHRTEEVVVFVHTVRVRLLHIRTTAFMKRVRPYIPQDLEEYGNITNLLEPGYHEVMDCIAWQDFRDVSDEEEQCTIGTIPSVTNVTINTRKRDRLVDSTCNLKLGTQGVAEAYRRTPVMKYKASSMSDSCSEDEEDGIQWTGQGRSDAYMVDNVPYDYYEHFTGKPLQFPIALGELWNLELGNETDSNDEDSMSTSDSGSSSDSEGSSGEHSGKEKDDDYRESSDDDSDQSA